MKTLDRFLVGGIPNIYQERYRKGTISGNGFFSFLVACLFVGWSECLLPPSLTYTLVKRENPETRNRRSGRRYAQSYKSEIRLKIILPFRWYALHNATDSHGMLDSSRINREMSRFYRYQFTMRLSTTIPRQVLRPLFCGQLTQNGSYRPHLVYLLKSRANFIVDTLYIASQNERFYSH